MAGFLLHFSSAAVETKAESEPPTSLSGNCFVSAMYATVWVLSDLMSSRITSLWVHTCFECYNKRGYIRNLYVYPHFLFDFAFDEIYRHLIFFTLGSSVRPWIDYSTTKWKMKLLFLPSPSPLILLLFPLRLFYCCCCCWEGICILIL